MNKEQYISSETIKDFVKWVKPRISGAEFRYREHEYECLESRLWVKRNQKKEKRN